jgi:hypothetical protein
MVVPALTHLQSSAPFGIPANLYGTASIILAVMYFGPTLIALGWALTKGQSEWPVLRLVRPLGRGKLPHLRWEKRSDRAA